jgi:hypothetical protein
MLQECSLVSLFFRVYRAAILLAFKQILVHVSKFIGMMQVENLRNILCIHISNLGTNSSILLLSTEYMSYL